MSGTEARWWMACVLEKRNVSLAWYVKSYLAATRMFMFHVCQHYNEVGRHKHVKSGCAVQLSHITGWWSRTVIMAKSKSEQSKRWKKALRWLASVRSFINIKSIHATLRACLWVPFVADIIFDLLHDDLVRDVLEAGLVWPASVPSAASRTLFSSL